MSLRYQAPIRRLSSHLRNISAIIRSRVQSSLPRAFDENRFIYILFVIFIRSFSNRHTLGGLKGYILSEIKLSPIKVFRLAHNLWWPQSVEFESYVAPKSTVPTYLVQHVPKPSSNSKCFSNLNIVVIVPDSWSHKVTDYGFPHLLHLQGSAKYVGANFSTFHLSQVLDKNLDDSFLHQIIYLQTLSPDVIFISGHKNSYSKAIESFLMKLKKSVKAKFFMIFLDDWSLDYAKIPLQWSRVIDYFLVYEYNSCIENYSKEVDLLQRIRVEPFPRAELIDIETDNLIYSDASIKFGFSGSLYLNRLPWLLTIKKHLQERKASIPLEIVATNSPGRHKNSIEQYLAFFQDRNRFVFHFLERTPNIFSFTSSVWDAFSCGSLVVAQVGPLHDPIEDFFIPGEHYLRFSNKSQLKIILDKLIYEPEFGKRIAKSGHEFWQKHYTGEIFYERLLSFSK